MKMARAHPLSRVSFTALAAAFVLPFASFGLRFSAFALLGVSLLASAFVVLSVGHFLIRPVLRHQLALALANVPILIAWWFVAAAMWYLAPGLAGAAVFGAILCVPAILLLIVLRKKGSTAVHAT